MPKYVFEVSVTLAADDGLELDQLNSINQGLCLALERILWGHGKRSGGLISSEPPFEHVVGDWLPPDENGVVKPKPGSRPIDYDPSLGTTR